jgi:hypothetical protein
MIRMRVEVTTNEFEAGLTGGVGAANLQRQSQCLYLMTVTCPMYPLDVPRATICVT